MEITECIWLDEIVEKIESKHHVGQTEVEDVLGGSPKFGKMLKGRSH
jgi:hypothetical protein